MNCNQPQQHVPLMEEKKAFWNAMCNDILNLCIFTFKWAFVMEMGVWGAV